MSRILIVEDEMHLAQGLRFNFEAEGHSVDITERGEDALTRLVKNREDFDALVLDVMLPGKDGFSVARELREAKNYIPLLMLTARGRPEDVLCGFEAGADDYLAKPFELAILIARLRGLLRRREWLRGDRHYPASLNESPPPSGPDKSARGSESERFVFDGKTIDFGALELRIGDRTVNLTLMEAELLRHLIKDAGQAVSRKSMLEEVWGLREDTDTRAIDSFIVRLRKYIEDEPSK